VLIVYLFAAHLMVAQPHQLGRRSHPIIRSPICM